MAVVHRPPTPPLPELPNATPSTADGHASYRTSHLQADLTPLLAWANSHRLTLPGLAARSASLEDLFLDIAKTETEETTR